MGADSSLDGHNLGGSYLADRDFANSNFTAAISPQ
jgi:hypothetical protein